MTRLTGRACILGNGAAGSQRRCSQPAGLLPRLNRHQGPGDQRPRPHPSRYRGPVPGRTAAQPGPARLLVAVGSRMDGLFHPVTNPGSS